MHIDETLRIFSPETDPHAIPPKRPCRRTLYFRPGEFGRLLLDGLRQANDPSTLASLVADIMQAKGIPADSRVAVTLQDRAAEYLRKQAKGGKIQKYDITRDTQRSVTGKD